MPHASRSRRAWRRWLAAALLLVSATGAEAASAPAQTITIGGTGAALGAMQLLADAYTAEHPQARVTVLPSLGSGGGIAALLDGAIEIAVSARSLKASERAKGAVDFEYARTPLAFVAGRGVALGDVSTRELIEIYRGTMTTWPDGQPIRVVLRPAEENDTHIIRSLSDGMNDAVRVALERAGMVMAATDQDNAKTIEMVPSSLGATTVGQVLSENRRLKLLKLDGVEPSVAALGQGRYPMFKALYFVTRSSPSPVVEHFKAFMLSAEGQNILANSGHLAGMHAPQAGM